MMKKCPQQVLSTLHVQTVNSTAKRRPNSGKKYAHSSHKKHSDLLESQQHIKQENYIFQPSYTLEYIPIPLQFTDTTQATTASNNRIMSTKAPGFERHH